jgi:hypothetical protein
MSTKLTSEQIKSVASHYVEWEHKYQEAYKVLKEQEAVIKEAGDQLNTLRAQLADTVQPVCGSAHLPSRRVYRGHDVCHVLIVQWEDKIQRGLVSVVHIDY